jgi:hypothetical protein
VEILQVIPRRRYWTTTGTVRAKVMFRIQRRPESASRTELDFLILGGTALQRSGANWRIEHPLSHRFDQNKTRESSPTCTVTDASKKAWADQSTLKKYLDQVLSESTLSSHSQRRRNAKPIRCRLGMPRPPYCIGQAAFTQAAAHAPPPPHGHLRSAPKKPLNHLYEGVYLLRCVFFVDNCYW